MCYDQEKTQAPMTDDQMSELRAKQAAYANECNGPIGYQNSYTGRPLMTEAHRSSGNFRFNVIA
jgi:hypothetical protein